MKRRRLRREALVGMVLIVLCLGLVGTMAAAVSGVFTRPPAVSQDPPAVGRTALPSSAAASGAFVRPSAPDTVSYNFLCLGTDVATGLSDTIVLLHLSADGGIAAVQLPRDTYIAYDGRETKLNACVRNLGPRGAADVLEQALCVRIDYTVSVTTKAFAAAVDAVGGVPMTVPAPMDYDDPYQNLHIHIPAGDQVLDGKAAEGFVRYRSGYTDGDLGRLDAQKKFLLSLLRTVREKLDFSAVSAIITDVFPQITTDLSLSDCLYFAGRVLESREGAAGLTLLTMPGKALWTEATGTSYFVLGREAALNAVNTYLNVFDAPVTDTMFDPDRCFVRAGDEDFERIYTYALIKTETVTGE